jgi:hypothetical protein
MPCGKVVAYVAAASPGRWRIGAGIVLALVLSGLGACRSFGEGVGRAAFSRMGGDPSVDTRACEIKGAPYDGMLESLASLDGQGAIGDAPNAERAVLKVILVHGIGSHIPGYSGRTVANLTRAMGLSVISPQFKSVELADDDFPGTTIGTMTAKRFADTERRRELVVYELTWSRISDAARAALQFDGSQVHTRNRARVNQIAKGFANDVLVDPLVYVGVGRLSILDAVRQTVCWAYSTDWDTFPTASVPCRQDDPGFGSRLQKDRYFFVTHSLGSRIVLDAIESVAESIESQQQTNPYAPAFRAVLQNHTATVFMMANQLPLLAAGFPPVPVTGQIDAYCTPSGAKYGQRMLATTRIVAFSDPNDLLSYPIPEDFVRYGIDSRLCPVAVNVTLNIARVTNVFGGEAFANPVTAHSDYNDDERVIGLMTGGLGQPETPAEVTERCRWIEVDEALR